MKTITPKRGPIERELRAYDWSLFNSTMGAGLCIGSFLVAVGAFRQGGDIEDLASYAIEAAAELGL